MKRHLTLHRTQIFEGPLMLVNPSHPILREGLMELVPADPSYPRVLLERRTAGLLQACIPVSYTHLSHERRHRQRRVRHFDH